MNITIRWSAIFPISAFVLLALLISSCMEPVPPKSLPAPPKPLSLAAPRRAAEDFRRNADVASQRAVLEEEFHSHGSDWVAWHNKMAGFREDIAAQIDAMNRPGAPRAWLGRNGLAFDFLAHDYLLAGDYAAQVDEQNPIPALTSMNKHLKDRGIDLLVAFVPNKAEVYPDYLSDAVPADSIVNPYQRKFLLELLARDVEVIDLLPAFLASRNRFAVPLFMPADSHWNSAGLQVASEVVAKRLSRYGFITALPKDTWQGRTVPCSINGGDLASAWNPQSPPPFIDPLREIHTAKGVLYRDVERSPLLVAGDSYAGWGVGVSGGLSAQLARATGVTSSLFSIAAGGPKMALYIAQQGPAFLDGRRIVLLVIVQRYLKTTPDNPWKGWP